MSEVATPPQLTDAQTGALVEARVLSLVPAGTPSSQKLVQYLDNLGHVRQAEPVQIVGADGLPLVAGGQIGPGDDFKAQLKQIIESATEPVFVKAAPGVWMSPFGGYGGPRNERLAFGKAEGFETNARGFALSGPIYYKRFRDVCIEMLTKYGVNQFKFDGIGRASR